MTTTPLLCYREVEVSEFLTRHAEIAEEITYQDDLIAERAGYIVAWLIVIWLLMWTAATLRKRRVR